MTPWEKRPGSDAGLITKRYDVPRLAVLLRRRIVAARFARISRDRQPMGVPERHSAIAAAFLTSPPFGSFRQLTKASHCSGISFWSGSNSTCRNGGKGPVYL